MIYLKSPREIEIMKKNGKIVAQAIDTVRQAIRPGVKTKELDRLAKEYIESEKAQPAFFGYRGYPANICVSIDEEVVHGIPGERELVAGQIVSVDIGVLKEGYYADGAATFAVNQISPEAARLLEVTKKALKIGLDKARVGNYLGDISASIQAYVEDNGFAVVRDLVGHGIGKQMHEDPQVPNFGKPKSGPSLVPGMVFAIEPMVNAGTSKVVTKPDGWTIVSQDGSLSAHFEHTVAVRENGPQVLTNLN
ncbi:MAG: type I methionyl aminopeptidase [candidate division Zixibacteria bacterium RBG_16_50_21]|nr:MAG: type I methionyl aminopeptidase [candidate division Zixibacteria bacterium RBG_16_50_21]